MSFEDDLLRAVDYYGNTGNDVRIRHLFTGNGYDVTRGHLLIMAPQARRFFRGRDLPAYVRIDPLCTGAALAPTWEAWLQERDSLQERDHIRSRAGPSGFRRSGTGGRFDSQWEDLFRYAGARGAHFTGTRARGPEQHDFSRVDLSGGDCIEVTARVVADNPNAPLARPERMKP
jgi:hypothetical protein